MLMKLVLQFTKRHFTDPKKVICLSQFTKMSTQSGEAEGPIPVWRPPPPCRVGDPLTAVDTPALFLDLPKMEKNLRLLPALMEKFPGVAWRPHAKAHKCPDLAKLQMQHGASGMCCQTLVEAEAMVYGGGSMDILVSNQVIGKPKLRRLAALASQATVAVCVDDVTNVRDISQVAIEMGVNIACVVEVNVGQDRCGVKSGQDAVVLAKEITSQPGITFKGIQTYNGWNQHIRKADDRKAGVDKVNDLVRITLKTFEEAGIACNYVSGGGTGTFPYEAASGLFTEVQPGSYVLMDADYNKNLDVDGTFVDDFEQSLYILTTVISVTKGDRAIVDTGMKGVSLDSGPPLVVGHSGFEYHSGGDEHGILRASNPVALEELNNLKVGDLLWLIPGHCDPTVNLYDWIVGVREGKVETLWPVLGRGPGV